MMVMGQDGVWVHGGRGKAYDEGLLLEVVKYELFIKAIIFLI